MRKVTSVLLILWILQFIDNGVAEVKKANSSEASGVAINLSTIDYTTMSEKLKQQALGALGKCSAQETRDDIQAKMEAWADAGRNYTGIQETQTLNPEELLKLKHQLCDANFMKVTQKSIENIASVLRKCLDKEVLPMFEKVLKFTLRSHSVLCSSSDEDISNLLKIQAKKSQVDTSCIQSLSSHFPSCITASSEIIELAETPSSWESFGMNILDGGSKECGIYDSFQNCIVKIMDPCPDKSLPNAIKFIFNFLYKSMNCGKP